MQILTLEVVVIRVDQQLGCLSSVSPVTRVAVVIRIAGHIPG